MKCLSLHQPYAALIALRLKTIETRPWRTQYRGDLLICSTRKPVVDLDPQFGEWAERAMESRFGVYGRALCVVRLTHCLRMKRVDESQALCPVYPGAWAWRLDHIRQLDELPRIRGYPGLFNLPPELRELMRWYPQTRSGRGG